MIRLFLILLGAELVRRRWPVLAAMGALWAGLGLFVFLDAFNNNMLIPISGLGYLLLAEGLLSLLAGAGTLGMARRMRWGKGVSLLVIGFLAIDLSGVSGDIALALIIGLGFMTDGVLKIIAARVVRFRGWRTSQAMGVLSIVLAVLTLQPWPTWYAGTIGCNVGIALVLSGLGAILLASRLRRLAPGASISELLYPAVAFASSPTAVDGAAAPGELIVHVWTPTGSAKLEPRPRRRRRRVLVERYIAATDCDGVVSTGHAALELAPDVYISHYPAAEIQRSPDNFGKVLRATTDNDLPGRFQPSYAIESAGWCGSTQQVRFARFDAARLRAFWQEYRKNEMYNLTSRNCSSVVAAALDVALDGALARHRASRTSSWMAAVRAISSPELWAATMLRRRAETMAWTPGLLLDYARAMSGVVEAPVPRWIAPLGQAVRRIRPRPIRRRARLASAVVLAPNSLGGSAELSIPATTPRPSGVTAPDPV